MRLAQPIAGCPVALHRRAEIAMTQHLAIDQTAAASAQVINIYGHSTLLYWWPAWAFGFVFALLNAGQERFLATAEGGKPSWASGGQRSRFRTSSSSTAKCTP